MQQRRVLEPDQRALRPRCRFQRLSGAKPAPALRVRLPAIRAGIARQQDELQPCSFPTVTVAPIRQPA